MVPPFFLFSKLGHELYSAASNYQPCGKIWRGREGEEQGRNEIIEAGLQHGGNTEKLSVCPEIQEGGIERAEEKGSDGAMQRYRV